MELQQCIHIWVPPVLLSLLVLAAPVNCALQEVTAALMTHFSGSRMQDYEWHLVEESSRPFMRLDTPWIWAKPDVTRDVTSYASLSQEVDAEPYLGQRVVFYGNLVSRGIMKGLGGFAVMFVRVVSVDGRTLAFDNMRDRRVEGWRLLKQRFSVLVDVPGPVPGTCTDPGAVPASIHVGFLLCGGRGSAGLQAPGIGMQIPRKDNLVYGLPPWYPPAIVMETSAG